MFNWIKDKHKGGESEPITLANLLRGTEPGDVQTVGVMQVVPLLSDLEDDRFVAPDHASVWTSDYGTISFQNESDLLLLVPTGSAYMVKERSQDHALPHAALVKGKGKHDFNTAMCIQETQGGLITAGEHKIAILPQPLREAAHKVRDKRDFRKLWGAISQFNESMGLLHVGNLVTFMDAFEKQLDEFVAEFEVVPRQVGAIVLIGGQVVGVERAPNQGYWLSVWEALIRECYGSLAVQLAHKGEQVGEPVGRAPLKLEEIRNLKDLEKQLKSSREQEKEAAAEAIRPLLQEELEAAVDAKFEGLDVLTLSNGELVGQAVRDGDGVCYVSLTSTERAGKNRKWKRAKDFSI